MALAKEEIVELTKKYGKDEKDTGNTKVQIALLTKEIADLTAHLWPTLTTIVQSVL